MSIPVRQGQMIDVRVEDLGHEGDGVAHYQGYVLFVPGTAPGDHIMAEVTQCGGSFGTAHPRRILTESSDRVEPRCEHYEQCGGCRLQHIAYDAELQFKRSWVRQTAERIAGASDISVQSAIASRESYGYRERSRFGLRPPAAGRPGRIGFRVRGTDELVDVKRCEIQKERNNRALQGMRAVLRDSRGNSGLWVADEFIIRSSEQDSLVLLCAGRERENELYAGASHLMERVPEVTGVLRLDEEGKAHPLMGREGLHFPLFGAEILCSAGAFTQVNNDAAEDLYRQVLRLASPEPEDVAVELFAGVGALSIQLASHAGWVFSVDRDAAAVHDARHNARKNDRNNITHLCMDAAEALQEVAKDVPERVIVVLDPPRSGCSATLLEEMDRIRPSRIVYIACSLGTWGRDVGRLRKLGWHLREVVPVDMFPQTANVEIVSLLESM